MMYAIARSASGANRVGNLGACRRYTHMHHNPKHPRPESLQGELQPHSAKAKIGDHTMASQIDDQTVFSRLDMLVPEPSS